MDSPACLVLSRFGPPPQHEPNSNPFCSPANLGCLREIQRLWVLLTGFLCAALGVLEPALQTPGWPQLRDAPASLCLQSAEATGSHHLILLKGLNEACIPGRVSVECFKLKAGLLFTVPGQLGSHS